MKYVEIINEDAAGHVDDLFEMANLRFNRTGVPGTIWISTKMASHGPRVKWYEGRPNPAASVMIVSISDQPAVLKTNGLSNNVVAEISPALLEWVRINHEMLQQFWEHGSEWFDEEVTAFKQSLKKVKSDNRPKNDE